MKMLMAAAATHPWLASVRADRCPADLKCDGQSTSPNPHHHELGPEFHHDKHSTPYRPSLGADAGARHEHVCAPAPAQVTARLTRIQVA